eukprot:6206593-Pleurochrysis_carterae.AAC.4
MEGPHGRARTRERRWVLAHQDPGRRGQPASVEDRQTRRRKLSRRRSGDASGRIRTGGRLRTDAGRPMKRWETVGEREAPLGGTAHGDRARMLEATDSRCT